MDGTSSSNYTHVLRKEQIMTKAITLTTNEASKKVGITSRSITKYIITGDLKASKVKGQYFIKASDLKSFISRRKKGLTSHQMRRFDILKPSTAAAKLGVDVSTIYKRARRGQLKTVKTNKGLRVLNNHAIKNAK